MKSFKYVSDFDIPIEIVSYKNSKSVKLFIKDGYIKITKPVWYSKSKVYEYIQKNQDDILKLYNKSVVKFKSNSLLNRDYIFLLGKKHKLYIELLDTVKGNILFEKDYCYIQIPISLSVDEKEKFISNLINNVYRDQTLILINMALAKYCKQMHISIPNFRLKRCKSIWGSCSFRGNLNFNIKMAMLPQYIADNIVVHELCHLKYKNHGKDFWDMVYSYCGKENYIEGEKWIKRNIPFSLDF